MGFTCILIIINSIIVFISSGLLFKVFKSVTGADINSSMANDLADTVQYDIPNAISVPGINLQWNILNIEYLNNSSKLLSDLQYIHLI